MKRSPIVTRPIRVILNDDPMFPSESVYGPIKKGDLHYDTHTGTVYRCTSSGPTDGDGWRSLEPDEVTAEERMTLEHSGASISDRGPF